MPFTTTDPIAVELEKVDPETTAYASAGWVYRGGTFRSIIFADEAKAVESIKRRFPSATLGGKPIDEVYPAIAPAPELPSLQQPTPGSMKGTKNPHVFVAGPDGYCLMCDNKQTNPIHLEPSIKTGKAAAKAPAAAPPPPPPTTGSLW